MSFFAKRGGFGELLWKNRSEKPSNKSKDDGVWCFGKLFVYFSNSNESLDHGEYVGGFKSNIDLLNKYICIFKNSVKMVWEVTKMLFRVYWLCFFPYLLCLFNTIFQIYIYLYLISQYLIWNIPHIHHGLGFNLNW